MSQLHPAEKQLPHRWTLAVLFFATLLAGCTASTFSEQPSDPTVHRQLADSLSRQKNYAAAAEQLRLVLLAEPNQKEALLRGDLLEADAAYRQAGECYRTALAYPGTAAEKAQLRYHLARLELEVFASPQSALRLLPELPEETYHQADLLSLIALQRQEYSAAAAYNLRAQSLAGSNEEKARGYYHSAKIWQAQGNLANASKDLFYAVNYARSPGLVGQLTRDWEKLRVTDSSR